MLVVLGKLNVLGRGEIDVTILADSIKSITIVDPDSECRSWKMSIGRTVEVEVTIIALFKSEADAIAARDRIVARVNGASS